MFLPGINHTHLHYKLHKYINQIISSRRHTRGLGRNFRNAKTAITHLVTDWCYSDS